MGVRIGSVATTTLVTTTLVTTAEAVVLTTPPLSLAVDNAQVLLFWYANVNTGTSTVGLNGRLRRGTSTTGAMVNIAPGFSVGAGLQTAIPWCYIDSPGVVAGQQYSLTLQQVAATANGTVNDGCLMALVL